MSLTEKVLWVEVHIVSSPSPWCQVAVATRGSIAAPQTRPVVNVSWTVTGASWKAASMSPKAYSALLATFDCVFSWTLGASGAIAAAPPTTAGRGS